MVSKTSRTGESVNHKTFIMLVLFLGFFLINTASANSADNRFDNNTLIIKSPKEDKVLLTIQQISVKPDLVTMEEIFKITAYDNYTFKKNKV